MNVVTPKRICLLLLAVLGFPSLMRAQQQTILDSLETYINQPVSYEFKSVPPYKPELIRNFSQNGTLSLESLGNSRYRVTYTPDKGFIGNDGIKVQFWSCPICLSRIQLDVRVKPTVVVAKQDFASTMVDESVLINVLSNDESTTGVLNLKSIPLVNNGRAQILANNRTVFFTPSPGFEGTAYFNYMVCDNLGTCSQGTVSIQVIGETVGSGDTLKYFTKKNIRQALLIPETFELTVPPSHGYFDRSGELPIYDPLPDFIGEDYMQFRFNGKTVPVKVVVLDYEERRYTNDDRIATSPYESVEFNVLENDLSNSCFQLLTQPASGSLILHDFPLGSMTYIPDATFEGVDKFTYSVMPNGCFGEPEVATVYVSVSNFEPAYSKYLMVTPKRTPLVVGNDVPIANFGFSIQSQGELGVARYLPGEVDTVVYGQRITGRNVILYIPSEDVISGYDAFELQYCVNKGGKCRFSKSMKIEVAILDIDNGDEPLCSDDCVWPGDTNFDGIVNMEDLLPLGLSMGTEGKKRKNARLDIWYGQHAENWNLSAFEEQLQVNLKHVDTDGDSVVTSIDTLAINLFYGNTHGLPSVRAPYFPYTIRLSGDVYANPGDIIELDMLMGDEQFPALDVYGFTFPLNYNPYIFKPESISIIYDHNSWLSYNSPVLQMTYNDQVGLAESGFTRTNGLPSSGYGKIGKVRLVVIDNLEFGRPGQESLEVNVGSGVATLMQSSGNTFGVKVEGANITINLKEPSEEDKSNFMPSELIVYPNPTDGLLQVHSNGGHVLEQVIVFNMSGQKVFETASLGTNDIQINTRNFGNGMYVLRAITKEGMVQKKFQVIVN